MVFSEHRFPSFFCDKAWNRLEQVTGSFASIQMHQTQLTINRFEATIPTDRLKKLAVQSTLTYKTWHPNYVGSCAVLLLIPLEFNVEA